MTDEFFDGNPGVLIEKQCRELRVSVAKVCREAGVDPVTVHRWKTGKTRPYWGSFQRMSTAIRSLREKASIEREENRGWLER